MKCSFCGKPISKGTGKIISTKSGGILYICSSKCEKNIALKRKPMKTKWTQKHQKTKAEEKSKTGKKKKEKVFVKPTRKRLSKKERRDRRQKKKIEEKKAKKTEKKPVKKETKKDK